MRKLTCLLLVGLLGLSSVACHTKPTGGESLLPSDSSSDTMSDGAGDSSTGDETNVTGDSVNSDDKTTKTNSTHSQKPGPSSSNNPTSVSFAPLKDDKSLGYTNTTLVGVDQFGRSFNTVSSMDESKQVGLFFFLWVGEIQTDKVYDAEKILALPGGKEKLFFSESAECPNKTPYYWGEPLWGYYRSADEFVIRRQLEMLTMAGVDYIAFDTTNNVSYKSVYMKILKVIEDLVNEGWDPPRAAFYTHTASLNVIRDLYNDLYGRKKYEKAWYKVNGKPMIIGYTNVEDDAAATAGTGGFEDYVPKPLSDNILNFFTFKRPQWPGTTVYQDSIPWVEWEFPQPMHGDTMNVAVASHPRIPMSFSITRGYKNWGRGWDVNTQTNVSANVLKGTFFQTQWDTAIKANPKNIFIGGWNEWVAWKQPYDGEYMLCDAANTEFSRDAEPMKGGYQDAYYQQILKNLRAYKGKNAAKQAGTKKAIQMAAGTAQWNDVKNVYRSVGAENYGRDHESSIIGLHYTQAAPRNNIQEVRVANDDKNLYFYIKCEKAITEYDGKNNWMNLFIGNNAPKTQGWEGYTYVINRAPKNGKTSVEKLSADYKGVSSGSADYRVDGSVMQVTVPRSAVGMASASSLYFKVADQVSDPQDIMNYYTSGKSLPLGRLSHAYNLK